LRAFSRKFIDYRGASSSIELVINHSFARFDGGVLCP